MLAATSVVDGQECRSLNESSRTHDKLEESVL